MRKRKIGATARGAMENPTELNEENR